MFICTASSEGPSMAASDLPQPRIEVATEFNRTNLKKGSPIAVPFIWSYLQPTL